MRVLTAIDIGSISVRMMVAGFDNEKLIPLHEELEFTRLGKGVNRTKLLEVATMERTLEVLKRFEAIAVGYQSEVILAAATSAIRDAKNGESFTKNIRNETGIDLQIVDGNEEATLTFGGAYIDLSLTEPIMLIDVGGGSTEIIYGSRSKISNAWSINAGAVRMTEKFLSKDPVDPREYHQMRESCRELIHGGTEDASPLSSSILVGVGGTITSLAAINQELAGYEKDRIHRYILEKEAIDLIILDLLMKDTTERKRISGLQSERADIILAGAVIVQQIMEEFNQCTLLVSESDILSGILWSFLGEIPNNIFARPIFKNMDDASR